MAEFRDKNYRISTESLSVPMNSSKYCRDTDEGRKFGQLTGNVDQNKDSGSHDHNSLHTGGLNNNSEALTTGKITDEQINFRSNIHRSSSALTTTSYSSVSTSGSITAPHYFSPILNTPQPFLRPLLTTQPLYSPILSAQQHGYPVAHPSPSSGFPCVPDSMKNSLEYISCSTDMFKDTNNMHCRSNAENVISGKYFSLETPSRDYSDVNHKRSVGVANYISPRACSDISKAFGSSGSDQHFFEEYIRMYNEDGSVKSWSDNTSGCNISSYPSHSISHKIGPSYSSQQPQTGGSEFTDCRLENAWHRNAVITSTASMSGEVNSIVPASKHQLKCNFTSNIAETVNRAHDNGLSLTAVSGKNHFDYQSLSAGISLLPYFQPISYQPPAEGQVSQDCVSELRNNQGRCDLNSGKVMERNVSHSKPELNNNKKSAPSTCSVSSVNKVGQATYQISSSLVEPQASQHSVPVNFSHTPVSQESGPLNALSHSSSNQPLNHVTQAQTHSKQPNLMTQVEKFHKNHHPKDQDLAKKHSNQEGPNQRPLVADGICLLCGVAIETSPHCLIDTLITVPSKINVGEKLGLMIGFPLPRDLLPSLYVCPKCFHLVNEVDVLEHRLNVCRREVLFALEQVLDRNGLHRSPYKRFQRPQQCVIAHSSHDMQFPTYQQASHASACLHGPYQFDGQNFSIANQSYTPQNHMIEQNAQTCDPHPILQDHSLSSQSQGGNYHIQGNHNVHHGPIQQSHHHHNHHEEPTHPQQMNQQLIIPDGKKIPHSTAENKNCVHYQCSEVSQTVPNQTNLSVGNPHFVNSNSVIGIPQNDKENSNNTCNVPVADHFVSKEQYHQAAVPNPVVNSKEVTSQAPVQSADRGKGSQLLESSLSNKSCLECHTEDKNEKVPDALVNHYSPVSGLLSGAPDNLLPHPLSPLLSPYPHLEQVSRNIVSKLGFDSEVENCASQDKAVSKEDVAELRLESESTPQLNLAHSQGNNPSVDSAKRLNQGECDIDIENCDSKLEAVKDSANSDLSSLQNSKESGKTVRKFRENSLASSAPLSNGQMDGTDSSVSDLLGVSSSHAHIPALSPTVTCFENLLSPPSPPPPPDGPPEGLRNVQDATEYHKPTLLGKNIKVKKHAKLQICRQCDQVFSNRQALIRHIERRHKSNNFGYSCDTCHRKFSSERMVKRHMQSHKTYPCKVCGKIFLKKTKLKKHSEEHRKSNLICKVCRKETGSMQALISHIKTHDRPPKSFLCSICSQKFTCKRNLDHHSRIHSGVKPFTCENCGISFRHRSNMVAHHKLCCGTFRYVCPTCGRGFALKSLFDRHMGEHEGNFGHSCSICSKGFSKSYDLLCHFSTHGEDLPSDKRPCSVCNEDGCNSGKIKVKNKKLPCHICGKIVSQKNVLQDHLAHHAGRRDYQCKHCSSAFIYKTNLLYHVKTVHLQQRPFTCDICHKTFSSAGSHKMHLRSHTGERPFQCTSCGKAFTSKSNYKRHLKCHIIHPSDDSAT